MQINGENVAIFWCKVYGVKAEPQLFNVMTHTNKMSYFAIFRMLNHLILQFFAYQTVLFCNFLSPKPSYFAIFVIIVKFPKVRSTQFELVTNCHRLTLKLVRGLKNLFL